MVPKGAGSLDPYTAFVTASVMRAVSRSLLTQIARHSCDAYVSYLVQVRMVLVLRGV